MLFQEEAGCSYSAQVSKMSQGVVWHVAERRKPYHQQSVRKPEPYHQKCATQSYLQAASKAHIFTREEEQYYARQLRQGEARARDKMIVHNLRLVIGIAQRYRGSELSLLERISEGNLGLFYAVEKFEPELGYKFSTYATPWIRQAIERSILVKQKLIRTPYRLARDIRSLKKAHAQLEAKYESGVTVKQLADSLAWSEEKIQQTISIEHHECSIDSEPREDARSQHDTLASDLSSPCAAVQSRDLCAFLLRLVQQLPRLQRKVVTLRYGLFNHQAHTLQEVASILGVSRERVRLIQLQVQDRLRREFERHGLDAQSIFADSAGYNGLHI